MNKTIRELVIKERCIMPYDMRGIGDEPDEEMAKTALKHTHAPVD